MNGLQKRRLKTKLYDLYVTNWNMVRNHLVFLDEATHINRNDIYVCPICLEGYTRSDLEIDQKLTLDHVPPEATGGKFKDCVLICGNCNHTIGSHLDSELKRMLEIKDFMNMVPGSTNEVKFGLDDDAIVPTLLKWSEDNSLLIFSDPRPQRSHPHRISRHFEEVERIKETDTFHGKFTVDYAKVRRWQGAMLRIAYLRLFKTFGYAAILTKNMHHIREQIMKPTEDLIPRRWFLGNFDVNDNDKRLGINIVRYPTKFRAFLVRFSLETNLTNDVYSVLLPPPWDDNFSIYDLIEQKDVNVECTLTNISEKSSLLTKQYLFSLSQSLWGPI